MYSDDMSTTRGEHRENQAFTHKVENQMQASANVQIKAQNSRDDQTGITDVQLTQLEKMVDRYKKEAESLKIGKDNLELCLQSKEKQIKEVQGREKELLGDLDKTQGELVKNSQQNDTLKKELEDAKQKALIIEERSKKLTQELECQRHNMEAVKTSLEQKVTSLQTEICILQQEKEEFCYRLKRKESQTQKLRSELQILKDQLGVEQRFVTLENTVSQQQEELKELKQELEQRVRKVASLESSGKRLQDSYEEVSSEKSDLEDMMTTVCTAKRSLELNKNIEDIKATGHKQSEQSVRQKEAPPSHKSAFVKTHSIGTSQQHEKHSGPDRVSSTATDRVSETVTPSTDGASLGMSASAGSPVSSRSGIKLWSLISLSPSRDRLSTKRNLQKNSKTVTPLTSGRSETAVNYSSVTSPSLSGTTDRVTPSDSGVTGRNTTTLGPMTRSKRKSDKSSDGTQGKMLKSPPGPQVKVPARDKCNYKSSVQSETNSIFNTYQEGKVVLKSITNSPTKMGRATRAEAGAMERRGQGYGQKRQRRKEEEESAKTRKRKTTADECNQQ